MLNKILISSAIFLLTISVNSVSADELAINPDHPDTYTVVKGDTLWDISARFLEQPWRWSEIWGANPQIENPHLIYPGDIVSLTYQDGKPVLSVNRDGTEVAEGRNVKLSPSIRSLENVEAIPTIPIDAIQQFLKRPLVLDDNDLDSWPYVVSSYDEHLIATTGNTIYVRGIDDESNASQYSIYRKGEAYVNQDESKGVKGEVLGYEAIYIGDATLTKKGDPASAIVNGVAKEILIGDRLIPQSDQEFSSEFTPGSTATEVKGNILSVLDGVSQIGQYQVVVVNLGENEGVEPGNVLGIYQSGYVVQDSVAAKKENIKLPEEYVGVVMVFRTFNKISYGLVMETHGPVHVHDTVRSL